MHDEDEFEGGFKEDMDLELGDIGADGFQFTEKEKEKEDDEEFEKDRN